MGLFKTKQIIDLLAPADVSSGTWPDDTIDEIDDLAFAKAIEAGRAAEGDRQLTVAA